MSWGEDPRDPRRDGRDDPASTWGQDPDAQWSQDPDPAAGWGQDPAPDRLRPLNLGDVLDGMFRLGRDHWRAFAIALGVIVVPLSLITGLLRTVTFGAQPGFAELLQDPETATNLALGTPPPDLGGLAAAAGFSALAGIFLTPLLYGIAVHVAATGYRDGRVDPMSSVRAAARRYPALLGATILVGLIPAVVFFLPMVLVLAGVVAGVEALSVIGAVGFLVSLAFAIIVALRLLLTMPALVIERLGPIEALRRSNALVKGKTGLVFGTALVVYIITIIIGIVLALPFGAVAGAFGQTVGAIAETLGDIVSSLVTNTLIGAALVLIYFAGACAARATT